MITIFMIIFAYLLGSISSAILLCQLCHYPDPRSAGSGNPGATNIFRLHGSIPAIFVLLFDILKGTLPVYSAYLLGIEPICLSFVAIAACLGHIYPLYYQFEGGKGVATALGAMTPIDPWLGVTLMITWFIIMRLTRYSSLAAIITAVAAPLYTEWFDERFTLPVALVSLLIIIRHHQNIKRLYKRSEATFKLSK